MYYKEDWDRAKQNLTAFWAGEDIGRPLMAVFAPRTQGCQRFPELQNGPYVGGLEGYADDDHEGIRRWWTDPEQNLQRMLHWFENTHFVGEAIPATYVNWGASAACAFYGSRPHFNKTSVWFSEEIKDWDDWKWRFDEETNEWWNAICQITEHLTRHAEGKFLVGMPEFGNAADNLSLMRGMDNLAMDLYDCPERVAEAIDFMEGHWTRLHEKLFQLTKPVNDGGGVLPWMSLWAPGRIDQLACDFSSVLSPAMFREHFVPDIAKMGAWTEYGMYHLDGPTCMENQLDVILEVPCVKAIEFTPGAGAPPTLSEHYIPRYKRILDSGRRLYLLAAPHEVEPLCNLLPSKGLFLCSFADSREAADRMIESAYAWSKKAGA